MGGRVGTDTRIWARTLERTWVRVKERGLLSQRDTACSLLRLKRHSAATAAAADTERVMLQGRGLRPRVGHPRTPQMHPCP